MLTWSSSRLTRYTGLLVARSTTALVGAPATIKAASILPSFRLSVLSPKLWYTGLMPVSASMP